MMLSSGLCIDLTDPSSGSRVGAAISTAWRVPPIGEDGDDVTVNHRDWLNAAAEVAEAASDDPLERTVIWRDLHFQLIRRMCCRVARREGR